MLDPQGAFNLNHHLSERMITLILHDNYAKITVQKYIGDGVK